MNNQSISSSSGSKKGGKRNASTASLESEQSHVPPPQPTGTLGVHSQVATTVSPQRLAQIAADAEMAHQLQSEVNARPMPAVTSTAPGTGAAPAAASSSSSTPATPATPERKPFKRVSKTNVFAMCNAYIIIGALQINNLNVASVFALCSRVVRWLQVHHSKRIRVVRSQSYRSSRRPRTCH
jgi:hypothetical protein